MPIITNITQCAAHGYPNTSTCWINYTLTGLNASNPNLLGVVQVNVPWVGLAIWVIAYVALFILFSKSGGREKFFAISLTGFITTIALAAIGVLGQQGSTAEIGVVGLSFLIFVISTIAYALIKDSGE